MDKTRLEALRPLKTEIKILTREIESFPQGIVADYAKDYPNGKEKVISIVGQADCSHLRKQLQTKLNKLQKELGKVEEWLDTIPDDEMRCIIRLRYRNGMTYEQIGWELGYDRSVICRRLRSFFAEQGCNKCNK